LLPEQGLNVLLAALRTLRLSVNTDGKQTNRLISYPQHERITQEASPQLLTNQQDIEKATAELAARE
jgi:hypothetical protein